MKNGKLVTAYLDTAAKLSQLQGVDDFDAWLDCLDGEHTTTWQACLDDGWTIAEMDAAYERRFGCKVPRQKA